MNDGASTIESRTGMEDGKEFIAWLAANHCACRVVFNRYDFERGNLLTNRSEHVLGTKTMAVRLPESEWQTSWQAALSAGQGAGEVAVRFECRAGQLRQAAIAVELVFDRWSALNYVLMPAAAYDGNRFLSRKIPYSPKLYFVQDIGKDNPPIISDVPRLNAGEGVSRIQERSGSLAVPAIGFQNQRSGRGCLIFTRQGNGLGDYGLSIEESRRRDQAVITVTSPLVRELNSYRICDRDFPSEDQPHDFKAGEVMEISFRLVFFDAPHPQDLFDRLATERTAEGTPKTKMPVMPFSACFELQEEKFNRHNFVAKHGYYSVGPRQNFLQDWQIGWTGGMISTYPLLFAGGRQTRKNVLRNFKWLFPAGIAPSGLFWDAGRNGTEWFGGDIRKPHTGEWHLIRKSGDAVFYIIKQFRLMEQLGIMVDPAWQQGLKGVCDALAKLWQKNKQFGQFVDSLTGQICVGGSTSGAIIPAALVLAADYFKVPKYLRVAVAAAEKFYQEFTIKGLSCGGPGDALQNPDSESWYALIESYLALYEATGKRFWLQRAMETSRQFSSWVVAYDFEFPPKSTFAWAGIRTTGAVYANTQNKHAAPGLCTFSGLGLLKLFRATGDKFHLELLRDIAFGLPQYLPHPQRPLGQAKPGWMCERVNLTDWEGPERIGETLEMTTWAETALMLTTIEIPGLYVQPDQSLVMAFDNITAEIDAETDGELSVHIHNPTPAAAAVRVFAESRHEAGRVLPDNYLLDGRIECLLPGESKTLKFLKS